MDEKLRYLQRRYVLGAAGSKDAYIRELERVLGIRGPEEQPVWTDNDPRLKCPICWVDGIDRPAAVVAPQHSGSGAINLDEPARYTLACEGHFDTWYSQETAGTELPYFRLPPGPQPDCEDPHRRCLPNPAVAAEMHCPAHPDGWINMDCDCEDCAAFNALPIWYPRF